MRGAGAGDRRPRRPARVPPGHDHARRRSDDRRALRPRRPCPAGGGHSSGRRSGRDGLPGPAARTAGRNGHRLAHHDPRRRSGARLRAPPRHPLPVDPLRARVGARRLRGPGSAVPPAGRRLRAPATWHPAPRAGQLSRPGGRRDRLPGGTPDVRRPRHAAPDRHRPPGAGVRRPALRAPPSVGRRSGDRGGRTGFECADTGIGEATGGLAGARNVRATGSRSVVRPSSHDGELLFWYVVDGSATLEIDGHDDETLDAGVAVAVPPGLAAPPRRCRSACRCSRSRCRDDCLGLGDLSDALVAVVADVGLHDDRRPPDVQRRATSRAPCPRGCRGRSSSSTRSSTSSLPPAGSGTRTPRRGCRRTPSRRRRAAARPSCTGRRATPAGR